MDTVIIRHPKERKSKCSLQPLVGQPGFTFYTAKTGFTFDATGYILLCMDAPELSPADKDYPLLLLDSTWRLLPRLEACITGEPIRRTLPMAVPTAYPRISKLEPDPLGGLASIEALYLAKLIVGQPTEGLLDEYYWKEPFLEHVQQAGYTI